MISQRDLVTKLLSSPLAKCVLETLAPELIPLPAGRIRDSKEINDPIWKIIRLSPLEVSILDTPLMQRLRGVKQLGLAHLVYPGATHTRLEHSVGVSHVAKRMFAGLAATTTSSLNESDRKRCGTLMGVTGLLHDCGHLAFSHLGERVLEDILADDFGIVRDIFADAFSGVVRVHRSDGTVSAPHPRPAELLSALFVISQPMVDLLNRQGDLGLPAEEMVIGVASLILGYAPELLVFGRQYLYFLKDIISGDIDADKIDYVARDGYFAGVPLAVDVERLLSQLVAIDLQPGSPAASFALPAREVECLYAIGLKPTGASAMEMLVLTRVYLFDRIYLHHKVKAAERLCESVLRSYLSWLVQEAVASTRREPLEPDVLELLVARSFQEPNTIRRILATMMRPGGDDGLLSEVAGLRRNDDSVAKEIGQAANDLLFRRLPVRALPVALRASARVDLPSGDRIAKVYWPHLKLSLANADGKERFEDRVIALCDDGKDLLFDYANRKPVPEDPDIWVSTSPEAAPERLNKYFSVEQLSNAYVELKETGWVFCDRNHQATVAAATAVALYEQFGIIPSAHALELAKTAAEAYEKALDDLVTCGKVKRDVIDLLKRKEISAGLTLHPFEIRGYLPKVWIADEIEQVARKIAHDLTAVQLPHSAGVEFTGLLPLVHLLLLHARASHDNFKRWEARPLEESKERFFHNDLRGFLQKHDVEAEYLSFSELHNQPGRIDLAFILCHNADIKFVVELKSEDKRFEDIVNEPAGQPMAYCTHEYSRISILYGQFGGDSFRLSDAIEVRQLRPDGSGNPNLSKLAAICIGHRAFGRLPSDSGRQSARV